MGKATGMPEILKPFVSLTCERKDATVVCFSDKHLKQIDSGSVFSAICRFTAWF